MNKTRAWFFAGALGMICHVGCDPVLSVGGNDRSKPEIGGAGAGGDFGGSSGGAGAATGGAMGSGGLTGGSGGGTGDGGFAAVGGAIGSGGRAVGGQGGARPLGPPPAPASFIAGIELTSRLDTAAVAIGDLNNDGKADLAVANAAGLGVSVLLGTGSAAFADAIDYAAGTNPSAIAIGDLDGDGAMDLVVANQDVGTVSVLFNDGRGAFGAPTTYVTGENPIALAVGDLNRDGREDIVVATSGMDGPNNPFVSTGQVNILLNTGAGVFGRPSVYLDGSGPEGIVMTDLNRDGFPDLAVVNYQQVAGGTESDVKVLINKGNATFLAPVSYDVGSEPASVVAGDLDGDRAPDLVVGGMQQTIMFNKGDGTFPIADTIIYLAGAPASPARNGVALGDVNGDGRLDLLAANDDGTVAVALNNGRNGFLVENTYAIGLFGSALVFGDLNGDGRGDLTVIGNNISALLNAGKGAFSGPASYAAPGPAGLTAADLNGDAKLDLAVANSDGHVSVLMNDGRGGFLAAMNYDGSAYPSAVVAADLNGDGKPDLAVANNLTANVSVFLNRGGGAFSPQVAYPAGIGATAVAAADMNGDGRMDLIVANSGTGRGGEVGSGVATVSVLFNRGGGAFAAPIDYALGDETHSIAVGDWNGDGKPDVVVNVNSTQGDGSSGGISILLNQGDGTLLPPAHSVVGSGYVGGVALGDLDRDGHLDLVVSDFTAGELIVLLNDGAGGFQSPRTFEGEWGLGDLAVGDVNGDGALDVVAANGSDGSVHLFLNYGDGTFFVGPRYSVGSLPGQFVLGDFDGDGKPDLALPDSTSVVVMTNNSP